ncbi:MAG TPA: peptidase S14 [Elusimicrobia bacterium]|nr:peptidase S14 [Elusimicrobiota bacterium]
MKTLLSLVLCIAASPALADDAWKEALKMARPAEPLAPQLQGSPAAPAPQPPQAQPAGPASSSSNQPFRTPATLPTIPTAPTTEQVELTKISSENQVSDQRLKRKLQKITDEREELRAQYELLQQRQKAQTAELEGALNKASLENRLEDERRKADNAKAEAELQKLSTQNRLADEKGKALLEPQDAEFQKLTLENKLSAEKGKKALDELSRQLEKTKLENDLRSEGLRELMFAADKEKRDIELALKRLELEERKLHFEKLSMDSRMAKLKSDLEMRDRKEEWKKEANKEPLYVDKPFQSGRLVVSDRRIPLNGPIFTGVADFVTERIHYYNNISSTQPIFIVIDRCPGGSVMEGYRIVKAMQASKAPVHVVVKSFAASMAAVITTLADQSYVYPNAIVLHHQMSTVNWGNMTQLKEQLELAQEWERRLHVPVAKKMGISIEAFRKKMYEKNSDGDWEEFGDKAVEYKWASSVVHEIDETGFTKNPDLQPKPQKPMFWMEEKSDEKGHRYVNLPRLDPFDFYFIYNPDRYYR